MNTFSQPVGDMRLGSHWQLEEAGGRIACLGDGVHDVWDVDARALSEKMRRSVKEYVDRD